VKSGLSLGLGVGLKCGLSLFLRGRSTFVILTLVVRNWSNSGNLDRIHCGKLLWLFECTLRAISHDHFVKIITFRRMDGKSERGGPDRMTSQTGVV